MIADTEDSFEFAEASPGRILLSGITDLVLSGLILMLINYYQWPAEIYEFVHSALPSLVIVGIHLLLRIVTIIVWAKTPAMFILGICLLNGDEERLNLKERFLAAVYILYKGVAYYKKQNEE